MKFLPIILKHLRHNWVRTLSTIAAMAVCVFLFCTLETFVEATTYNLKSANDTRLVTRHSVSLVFPLPVSYREKIRGLPGVERVAISNWFGGVYRGEMKNFFPNFAVDAEEYLAMYPEYLIPEEQKTDFFKEMKACVVGRETADRFDWKLGTVFQLESFIPRYRKADGPFEFVVRGIYETDDRKYPGTNASLMFCHYKYLYEGTGQQAQVGTFMTKIADPARAVATSSLIDELFENSDAATKTETEAAFRASFVSLGGNLAFLLRSVGLAVAFTILLVTANTMSMAIRERRTEIGILKTLGFSNALILGIVLGEAVMLGALGGICGIQLAHVLIQFLPKLPFIGDAVRGFPGLGLSLPVATLAFTLSVLLGLIAGLVPAILSYRARITNLLRHV